MLILECDAHTINFKSTKHYTLAHQSKQKKEFYINKFRELQETVLDASFSLAAKYSYYKC